jgi:homoserine dehydrogenase
MTFQSTAIVNVGTGLVGSEVLDQLLSLPQYPEKFGVLAIASSKLAKLYDNADLQKSDWRQVFKNSETGQTLEQANLLEAVKSYASQNPGKAALFIDNTASDEIAKLYPELLRNKVSVVTPNKKAYSSELQLYNDIVAAAKEGDSKYYLESTVGAGLPIISTLKDLVGTGDTVRRHVKVVSNHGPLIINLFKVTKIEGVFSGTLSYLFNVFSTTSPGGPSFSSTVAIAREKGFTVRVSCSNPQ